MVSTKVVFSNAAGLDVRPAGLLCDAAMKFSSRVTFRTDQDYEANAKSVLSVLGACVRCGQEVELICEGDDEEEALDYLKKAIEAGLGE